MNGMKDWSADGGTQVLQQYSVAKQVLRGSSGVKQVLGIVGL